MRRITPDMPREVAQRILWEESGDLKACWRLIDLAEEVYNVGYAAQDKALMCASASLVHAEAYLRDRAAYESAPWPKNQIKVEMPARKSCKHEGVCL